MTRGYIIRYSMNRETVTEHYQTYAEAVERFDSIKETYSRQAPVMLDLVDRFGMLCALARWF